MKIMKSEYLWKKSLYLEAKIQFTKKNAICKHTLLQICDNILLSGRMTEVKP